MKEIYLKNIYGDSDQYIGEWLEDFNYNVIMNEDCRIYKPPNIEGEKKVLAVFRKNVFSEKITADAFTSLEKAATSSENRGIAAGPITEDDLEDGKRLFVIPEDKKDQKRYRAYVIRKEDGGLSNTSFAKIVKSGIAGYFDRYTRIPYCRTTAYTKNNMDKFKTSLPFIQNISQQFKETIPDRWVQQKNICDRTHSEFVIDGTVFSTITVNKNFRTAGHTDAGDYMPGFGNLTVLDDGNPYEGGYLVFPKFKVAIDVRRGDFLAMDVHEVHGNTKIIGGGTRLSLVCYYRQRMADCETFEHEKLREDYFNLVGYHAGMWDDPEWDYVQEVGFVKKGMFKKEEYGNWLNIKQNPLENFMG